MKVIHRGLLAAGLLAAAGSAHAQFSSTITATNDYDFRGFSQSAKDPALQASLDYGFANGFAIGAWASNIDFDPADGDVELNLYAGYTGEISENSSWSGGIVYYDYPGSDDISDYFEGYLGLGVGPFGVKQWYSDELYGVDAGSAWYTEVNGAFEVAESISILAHIGYSYGDYWDNVGDEVLDYSIGVGYDWNNFSFVLKYVDTDSDIEVTTDVGNNEGRVIFTVATTLPWE
jgi:uncharacterized protein (TIGR02001 family)